MRTRDITTGRSVNEEPEVIQLQDDGYRIYVAWLSGRPVNVEADEVILWAEYKHCDMPRLGNDLANLLMTGSVNVNR